MKFRCNKPYFSINYFEVGVKVTKEEYIKSTYTYRAIKPSDAQFKEYLEEHCSHYPSTEELQELYSTFSKDFISREQERYLKEHLERVDEEILSSPNIQGQFNITFNKDGIYETSEAEKIEGLRKLIELSKQGLLDIQVEEID